MSYSYNRDVNGDIKPPSKSRPLVSTTKKSKTSYSYKRNVNGDIKPPSKSRPLHEATGQQSRSKKPRMQHTVTTPVSGASSRAPTMITDETETETETPSEPCSHDSSCLQTSESDTDESYNDERRYTDPYFPRKDKSPGSKKKPNTSATNKMRKVRIKKKSGTR